MGLNFYTKLLSITIFACAINPFFLVVQPLCIEDDKIALMQFKESLTVNKSASVDPLAYPKTASWNDTTDCCLWDGVTCDGTTGQVISLDLSSSFLYGSINSDTGLFSLTRLERLNLADNNFNNTRIPPELGRLSKLRLLNLSSSSFIGLPTEISLLTNLSSIDLTYVNISSQFPDFFTNFSSLTHLVMKNCGVYGEFPEKIFHLPKIEFINAQHNSNLTGHFPDFKPGSTLKTLWFCRTNFSGGIPFSIGNLKSLEFLSIARAKFSGLVPSSLGGLTNITYLDLSFNNFVGEVPSSLQNLTKLNIFWCGGNQLTGQIPTWIGNLTSLAILSFARNKLSGPIPQSLSRLTNLRTLNLFENGLGGTLDFDDMFRDMKSLAELRLERNKLSVTTKPSSVKGTLSEFEILGLSDCSLTRFPDFLRYQEKLRFLDLGGNNIQGPLPNWVWNTSKDTMVYLALNDNNLTSIGRVEDDELSFLFCNLTSLQLLDLSNNLLGGMTLPKCLENPKDSLSVLNIRNNMFHGVIPQMCSTNNGSQLKMIDLGNNQLNGRIPKSLSNCLNLESLNLGNNRLVDVFPSWLGALPKLRLLVLRSNQLHGEILGPVSINSNFSNLRVIDLSSNNFSGNLPSMYFQGWSAMQVPDSSNLYLRTELSYQAVKRLLLSEYTYSTTITVKGTEVRYGKIQEVLVVIDFSTNKFHGEIPDSIGSFQGLRALNLSNNLLSGVIPSSLGNIARLESLDVSQNQLSGEIPLTLVDLTFLAFFNVSYNCLAGRIPRGNQHNTFENNSYVGNPELCGAPLTKRCGGDSKNDANKSDSGSDEEDNHSKSMLKWVTSGLGYLGGLVVGVILESTLMAKRREKWVAKICSRKKRIKEEDMYF